MDLNKLQLKLEELGVEGDKIDEILSTLHPKESAALPELDPEVPLELLREYETDWRRKAIISAEIVKKGLNT